MEAFDLGLGFEAAVLVVIATTFGFFVPSSPGSFGVYHAIAIGTLTSVYDVDKNRAVSFALVTHLIIYVPPMLLGAVFFWRMRAAWGGSSLRQKFAGLRAEPLAAAPPPEP
jgi:uncharacterized membrane protein YbhN (UPF0104 family)